MSILKRKSPRIFVLCPDSNATIGGVKILYKHVDVLNENGFDAAILHGLKGFRCTWFENDTKVESLWDTKMTEDDFLVLPEIYGPNTFESFDWKKKRFAVKYYSKYAPPVIAKKVIFNQNFYNTFSGYNFDPADKKSPYLSPDLVGVMVVSEDSRDQLKYVFPHLKIHRIHNAINAQLFSYEENKKKQICFMPRKHSDEAMAVINMLKFRGVLDGYTIVPIDNMDEQHAGRLMKESLFFFSFGYHEGFSLPPAEAMSSGCLVIGYHGKGGHEYFKGDFCFPIADSNVPKFARTAESVLKMYEEDPAKIHTMRKKASEHIQSVFTAEREEKDILAAWRDFLGNSF
ncbi:MAG: hypothetical protein V4642_02145 [Bacteroidota bacterium]